MKNELTPQILAMYLGQKCDIKWTHTDPLDGAFKTGDVWHDSTIHGAHIIRLERGEAEITPHLRPLSSLTEQEALELFKISRGEEWDYEYNSSLASRDRKMGKIWSCLQNWWAGDYEMFAENGNWCIGEPQSWLYLLSKGFDLFGGIEAGWAKEIETKI